MNRSPALSTACAVMLSLFVVVAAAQSAPHAKSSKAPVHHHVPAAANSSAAETNEPLTQAQLDIAPRVLTGVTQCEFNQHVSVQPINGKPGFFKVGFKNTSYVMVPEETSTGAVRLEDKKVGIVWIQIPAKSMLMNSKIGQRMVDNCVP